MLFFPWRHSVLLVRPLSWLAKNRRQGKPCQYARYWSVRYGALCRSKLLSPALWVSLVPPRIVEKATENEIYASGKFCLLSLSLSLSLRVREHTRGKRSCSPSTVDPSKSSQSLSTKFILSSLDSAFNMWKSNCVIDESSAGVTVVGSTTKLGVPAVTGLLQHTVTECCHQIQVSRAHTAGSGWFKRKKVQSLFRGSCNA